MVRRGTGDHYGGSAIVNNLFDLLLTCAVCYLIASAALWAFLAGVERLSSAEEPETDTDAQSVLDEQNSNYYADLGVTK